MAADITFADCNGRTSTAVIYSLSRGDNWPLILYTVSIQRSLSMDERRQLRSVSYSPPSPFPSLPKLLPKIPLLIPPPHFSHNPPKTSSNHQMLPPHFSPLLLSSLLLLSLPALWLLFPEIIPQSLPLRNRRLHGVNDLNLLRRAILSPPSTSSFRQPKIAFLFLTNTDLYFAPLWEKFFQNNTNLFNIYIHLDPSAQLEKPLTGLFANQFVPAKPTQRASPSLITATKRLLAAALIDDAANEYFALVSQSCVPIHSFEFVYQSLVSDQRKRSFIEILSGEPQLWDRYIARGEDVMLPEVSFEQFRIGSQFFVLARRHAHLVIRERRLWRKFRKPCLPTMLDCCYPEEHYFPTLLSMKDPEGCSGYTLTRVNWTDTSDGHPHMYMPPEITPQLIQELRRTNDSSYSHLFARKFSKECLEPLMAIADDVIFHDQ
ncbi:hypothetical protein LUZ63_002454 [Rhynchospora breviuscula]|uniref:Uncharacterized protein n=1 Tax=Rhynchospora breviuscula TaxID=2022672 RepID=A0A9Q0HYI6_9POAL|nr:hypothetical protein LUZ63_002454 [Rhynchospora breviuscula]